MNVCPWRKVRYTVLPNIVHILKCQLTKGFPIRYKITNANVIFSVMP